MPRIVIDRSGNLQKGVFYRFNVPFEDQPAAETPTAEWIVVPRTPRADQLTLTGEDTYTWIQMTSGFENLIEIKDCPAKKEHVTHQYYKRMGGEKMSGKRVSPFVPCDTDQFVLSEKLHERMKLLKLRGARIDSLDLVDHYTDAKVKGFWSLQFVGKAKLRLPTLVDCKNACPHCGKGVILCESCGDWSAYCKVCEKQMVIIEWGHKGKDDLRIPFEEGLNPVLGNTWDGSDLIQGRGRNIASKRFIDWLLRIHAAPFYAEPVYFCVDGMTDQQKKWFDDLQKPFEV